MRLAHRLLLTLALVAVPLAGCIQAPAADFAAASAAAAGGLDESGLAPVRFGGHQFLRFQGTSETGRVVHAEAWVPDVATRLPGAEGGDDETFPAILIASPYWGAGTGGETIGYENYDYWIEKAVPRGYAVVFGDLAGNGGSGGCWDFMGPEDQASAVALVEAIAAQPWSDGKVGMIGISYDGMSQVMAASRAAEHLVTVVPVAPLTHAYAGIYQGGVHYGGGWMATTTAYTAFSVAPPVAVGPDGGLLGGERLAGWADRAAATPPCLAENTAMGNDPTGAYNAYYQARDFRPLAKDVTASVFFIQGFLDANVKPDNAFPWWHDVPGPKKLWLGHWFHQFPNAEASGREDMFLTLHRWFDHELKGVENGILDEPVVDVQDSLGRWRHEATWPPADAEARTLFLGGDGALSLEPAEEGRFALGGPRAAVNLLPNAAQAGLAFSTGKLDAPLHVAGVPTLNLTVASDRPGGQVVARLYDVGDGAMRLVSQGALNLMVRDGAAQAQPLTPGAPVEAGVALYPTDHVVPAGHELVLRLFTTAPGSWYNPDPWAATLTAEVGGDAGARLVLPVVERGDDAAFLVACGKPLERAVPECYDEDRKDLGADDA